MRSYDERKYAKQIMRVYVNTALLFSLLSDLRCAVRKLKLLINWWASSITCQCSSLDMIHTVKNISPNKAAFWNDSHGRNAFSHTPPHSKSLLLCERELWYPLWLNFAMFRRSFDPALLDVCIKKGSFCNSGQKPHGCSLCQTSYKWIWSSPSSRPAFTFWFCFREPSE